VRLGVLGTMVWDRIDHPHGPRVERWGGIAYSLAAAAAVLPAGWSLRPLVVAGRDLAEQARAFAQGLPGLEDGGWLVSDAENNRVHLRYRDAHHRHECLTGGVPPWRWEELGPRLEGLDALYVNLISGFELELETAARLREAVGGPVYADLHSLLLGVDPDGHRVPRRLDRSDAWLAAFDVVQVNERELGLLGPATDPWLTAEDAVRHGLGAMFVTRGPEGVTAIAAGEGRRPWRARSGPVRRWDIPVSGAEPGGDPTGCGDVWGATCFVALLRGESLTDAARSANRLAARNLAHRGADGLYTFLRETE
jgi:sugar/nucleoside kinase (ribokinase family)